MTRRKRGATELSGILPIDKPAGMTSHDVVATVRRATGEGRVGHAGTLDPAATGLLVVLLGPMTRLARFLTGAVKTYDAEIVFGAETDTDDAEGEVTRTAPAPESASDPHEAAKRVEALLGEHSQVPPAFSALKVGGRTAHREARAGRTPTLAARKIRVERARLLSIDTGPPVAWRLELAVSKGTYVRAIARDLGRDMGCAAHLGGLRRMGSGTLSLSGAHTLDDVAVAAKQGRLAEMLVDPASALDMPGVPLTREQVRDVAVGRALPGEIAPALPAGSHIALLEDGALVAVYKRQRGEYVPAVVLPRSAA